jgi:hypothetical protein
VKCPFIERSGKLKGMKVPEQIYTAEMERMMKFHEVILNAMAGQLKWWKAAEILRLTDRQRGGFGRGMKNTVKGF